MNIKDFSYNVLAAKPNKPPWYFGVGLILSLAVVSISGIKFADHIDPPSMVKETREVAKRSALNGSIVIISLLLGVAIPAWPLSILYNKKMRGLGACCPKCEKIFSLESAMKVVERCKCTKCGFEFDKTSV